MAAAAASPLPPRRHCETSSQAAIVRFNRIRLLRIGGSRFAKKSVLTREGETQSR
jgi:hypothetical protein